MQLPPCNRFLFICLSPSHLTYHLMTIFKQSLQNKNSNKQSSGKCFSPTATLYNKLDDRSTTWTGGDKILLALSFQTPFFRDLQFNHNNWDVKTQTWRENFKKRWIIVFQGIPEINTVGRGLGSKKGENALIFTNVFPFSLVTSPTLASPWLYVGP